MTGPKDWTDERLTAAYRVLAGAPPSAGVIDDTLGAIADARRPRRLTDLGRGGRALAGLAAGVAVLAVVAATLYLRPTAPAVASPSGSIETSRGVQPVGVAEALAAEARGAFGPDDLVAIRGWLYIVTVPHVCPDVGTMEPLERDCGARDIVLSDDRQESLETIETDPDASPLGAHVYVQVLYGSAFGPIPADAVGAAADGRIPARYRAVVVGHFHDRRAGRCSDAARQRCLDAFVADAIAEVDGRALLPGVWRAPDAAPKLTAEKVLAIVRPALGPDDTVVSVAATLAGGASSLALPAPGGVSDDVLWYVRVAGPPPRFPPLYYRGGQGGWIVVDDASGSIAGAGGWGFTGAGQPGAPGPGTRFASGEYVLPTTNWLGGRMCAGVGLDAVVHGDAKDARIVWLENRLRGGGGALGTRRIVWPGGYRARFAPGLEILDAHGTVVLREGSAIGGACVDGNDDLYLEPPFL